MDYNTKSSLCNFLTVLLVLINCQIFGIWSKPKSSSGQDDAENRAQKKFHLSWQGNTKRESGSEGSYFYSNISIKEKDENIINYRINT